MQQQPKTYLDFCAQDNMCIPFIRQPKDPTKLVHCQFADISDLEFWWLRAHLQLNNLDPVCYDGRLVTLVEGGIEHLYGIGVKLVGKARPFECERHLLYVEN